MAASNKTLSTSHDLSTDTDDDIQYDSDSAKDEMNNSNDVSTSTSASTKHRGYVEDHCIDRIDLFEYFSEQNG